MQLELGEALNGAMQDAIGWVETAVRSLPEFLAAVLVLLVFVVLAKVLRSAVERLTSRATTHRPVVSLVGTITYIAVIAGGVFVALGILQLEKTVTSLLAGVGILGLALGFAFQDIAENFIAGILITLRRPFTDGDLIESNGFFGHVETVDLRATRIRTLTGQLVRVPNADIFGNPITNFSQATDRRVDVPCGVSYGDDLDKAKDVALDAMRGVEGRDEGRDPELFYDEFGGSSINFTLRFWIRETGQKAFLAARSDAMVRLKKAFDENDVGIPFPIVTLDFSEAGGRRLDEPLQLLRNDSRD